MFHFILLILLIAQDPEAPVINQPEHLIPTCPTVSKHTWERVQIQSMGIAPKDPAVDDLIDKLNSDNYEMRRCASRQLKKLKQDVLPALYFYEDSKFPEVRLRVRTLLRQLATCENCKGNGKCIKFTPDKDKAIITCTLCGAPEYNHGNDCIWCDGTGCDLQFGELW